MRNPILIAALLLLAHSVRASEVITLVPTSYADNAAAQAAWTPIEGAPVTLAPERTPDGKPALALRSDMARVADRTYWDLKVHLDLSRHGKVAFWVKAVGDTGAISSCTLYFNAGAGWYDGTFAAEEGEWQRVTLDQSKFTTEGAPSGWNAVSTIRLAFWKGQPRVATVYLGPIEAPSSRVAVVNDTRAGKEGQQYAERMVSALNSAGIDAETIGDTEVEKGGLAGKRIAIYPNNTITDAEAEALNSFTQQGGHILACYALPTSMGKILGIDNVGYQPRKYDGQFARMRAAPATGKNSIVGMPAQVHQASWNITAAKPSAKNAHVAAEWFDDKGKDTGFPAVIVSDSGAYVSHVILDDAPAERDRLLRALLGAFDPSIWSDMADANLLSAGRIVTRWADFEQTARGIEAEAKRLDSDGALKELDKARKVRVEARSLMQAGRWPEALDAIDRAKTSLTRAFALAQETKAGEFRAVWCHSAYGVQGMTWDAAIKRLKECGFTAVVPNMLWGGQADYNSKVLPVSERVKTEGDQIALCLAACRKYGLKIHVWKVDWNLATASPSFVARMRTEKRLQATANGVEEPWLCPSNPANVEMERASLLEIVRNYDVDGIHFDYIRYPDGEHCYCDGCRSRFEALAGAPVADWPKDVLRGGKQYEAYQQFRRDNITHLVKTVSEEAHKLKPGIKVSAAVFSSWPECRESVGQDWAEWVKRGYLDFVCPMDYTASNSGYRSMIRVQREAIGGRVPLYPGVGASAPGLDAAQVIDQVQITRKEKADGFIVFQYDARTASDQFPLMSLGATR